MRFKKITLCFGEHLDRVRNLKYKYINKRETEKARKDLNNKFLDKINDDKLKINQSLHNEYDQLKDNTHNDMSLRILPRVINEGCPISNSDKTNNEFGYDDNVKPPYYINIRPDADDSTLSHEYQHFKNFKNGEHPGIKSLISKFMFNDNNYKESILKPNRILDYSNNVLQEELSANRGRVMNSYLYGGDKVNDDLLNDYYTKSNLNQGTYESTLGGYNPPSLRYNMDKDAYNNLMNKINK